MPKTLTNWHRTYQYSIIITVDNCYLVTIWLQFGYKVVTSVTLGI